MTKIKLIVTMIFIFNFLEASVNTCFGQKLYLDPNSNAARYQGPEKERALMAKVAKGATAMWCSSGWMSKDFSEVKEKLSHTHDLVVLVLYDIPYRDCGQHSAGGAFAENYPKIVEAFAKAIGDHKALIVLEPDALCQSDRLTQDLQQERFKLIREAVRILKANSNTQVFIDAGNPGWKKADEVATLLQQAAIAEADGFALNVSNFFTDSENIEYSKKINLALGTQKLCVIDSSRNGNGALSKEEWCNPPGRALGELPGPIDEKTARLWIKVPGESDGECNGGPKAGTFWPEYALGLATRCKW